MVMTLKEKNELVKNYIIKIANEMNNKYSGIMNNDKINRAIEMFENSYDDYDKIVEKVDFMANQIIENYMSMREQNKGLANMNYYENAEADKRESCTFEEIKHTQQKVQEILNRNNLKIYIAGGSVPYLLQNQDSGRLHDDIDTICKMEDMDKLREVFKKEGLYKEDWDSKTVAYDGQDYGFEMKIDGVPFGIYPFVYNEENKIVTQYSFDPYNKSCKTKNIPMQELTDYIMSYKGLDGKVYDTMSVEYIKLTKDAAGRPKDIADSKKIEETKLLRPDVFDRIQMYVEVKKKLINRKLTIMK